MVTWEQRGTEGDPKFEASQDLPPFDYAGYARMLGLHGRRVERPDEIGVAWELAYAADRPTLLDMVTDPSVPPLPPHIAGKQIRAYISALTHRDPEALQVIVSTAREWWKGRFGG